MHLAQLAQRPAVLAEQSREATTAPVERVDQLQAVVQPDASGVEARARPLVEQRPPPGEAGAALIEVIGELSGGRAELPVERRQTVACAGQTCRRLPVEQLRLPGSVADRPRS
jgi:hypothetical protein